MIAFFTICFFLLFFTQPINSQIWEPYIPIENEDNGWSHDWFFSILDNGSVIKRVNGVITIVEDGVEENVSVSIDDDQEVYFRNMTHWKDTLLTTGTNGIYFSTDLGYSWTQYPLKILPDSQSSFRVNRLASYGDSLFIVLNYHSMVYLFHENELTYLEYHEPLQPGKKISGYPHAFSVTQDFIFLGTSNFIYRYDLNINEWQKIRPIFEQEKEHVIGYEDKFEIRHLLAKDSMVLFTRQHKSPLVPNSILFSTNHGVTWDSVFQFAELIPCGEMVLAQTWGDSLYQSPDFGKNWSKLATPQIFKPNFNVECSDQFVFVDDDDKALYRASKEDLFTIRSRVMIPSKRSSYAPKLIGFDLKGRRSRGKLEALPGLRVYGVD